MPNSKQNLGEWVYAAVFAVVKFAALRLHLSQHIRSLVFLCISLTGVPFYFIIFRERFRGRWVEVSIVSIVSAALVFILMYLYESHA